MPRTTVAEQGALRVAKVRRVVAAMMLVASAGCGGGSESEVPVRRETPQDRILRVAKEWRALLQGHGSPSASSAIDRFADQHEYVLALHPSLRRAKLRIAIKEEFEMRNGAQFRCEISGEIPVKIDYFWRGERAGLELREQAIRLERRCNAAGFPEPILELPGGTARFTLSSDQLVPLEPPGERRVYIPSM